MSAQMSVSQRRPGVVLPALLLLITLLSACGPKVDLKPGFAEVKPRLVALLPTKASPDVRAERIAYLEQSLEAALESRGFALVDRPTVQKLCRDEKCSGKKELLAKYPVQGLFQFDLDSIDRNNFGIGYWNTITGKLTLADVAGTELLTIDHTEREKGGVVFESGQVIQGIISQVRNAGDDAYNRLADKFARTLALRIPQPEGAAQTDVERADVGQVTAEEVSPEVYKICAEASASSMTSLIVNRLRAPLRPVSSGLFCGIFHFDAQSVPSGPMVIEARSAFGDATRREVPLRLAPVCDLNGRVQVAAEDQGVSLKIECTPNPADKTEFICERSGSPSGTPSCSAAKFLVYRSRSEIGPYVKVAEVRGTSWVDRMRGGTGTATYHIVAVRPDGGLSSPARAGGPAPAEPIEAPQGAAAAGQASHRSSTLQ